MRTLVQTKGGWALVKLGRGTETEMPRGWMILEVVQRDMRNAMGREEPLLMHLHSTHDGLSQGKCMPGMRHAADWTAAPFPRAGTC
jgi:hypothetical protein